MGDDVERLVAERLEAVLPHRGRRFSNVEWLSPTREGGPARDGEIDVLLVLPEHGLLAIEVKGGTVSLDGFGRWYAGRRLDESPFKQASTGKQALRRKIERDHRWHGEGPRVMHAVAFPGTDRASLLREGRDLGPDAPLELVIDREDLADDDHARQALDRVIAYWSGDGARDRTLSEEQLAVILDVIEPAVVLRPLLRGDIRAGEQELLAPTHHQLGILKTLRRIRRAAIRGGAGSGKTLLAAEKARSLAADGFDVLLVCFNQPLARALAAGQGLGLHTQQDLAPHIASGRITVSTFHELCRRLGAEARTLPPQPRRPGSEWFGTTLPKALEDAIPTVGGRWQAVIVDEGQDFDPMWLLMLDQLLATPGEGVLYLFHDPAQAIYRPDASDVLGLTDFPLPDNCRNAKPIHEFAYRWYDDDLEPGAMREDGRDPLIVEADGHDALLVAVRAVLHELVQLEGVDRSRIAVLTGVSLEHSAVWRQRRFRGGLELWNGNVDDAGRSLGLSADQAPEQPPNTIACDTIHRFKGLERDVVVLTELRADDERLGKLLYVGASRAKHHLVLVVTPELAQQLRRVGEWEPVPKELVG
jgi:hypothetical protein